jgi:hypothetical protein
LPTVHLTPNSRGAGIILFELFSQFATEMERRESIAMLKQQDLPSAFLQQYPFVSVLSLNMTAQLPSLRPSLPDLTRGEFASFTTDLVARPANGFKLLTTFSDGRQLQCVTPTCEDDEVHARLMEVEPGSLAEAQHVIARLRKVVIQQREALTRLAVK